MFDVKGPYLDVSGVLKYSVIVQLRGCLLFSRVTSRIVNLRLYVQCIVHNSPSHILVPVYNVHFMTVTSYMLRTNPCL